MKLALALFLLVLLYTEVNTQLQHVTSEKKWELLLKTIGAKGVEVVKVTDDKIMIKTDREHLKNLRKLLGSEDTLQKNTLHALFCNNRKTFRRSTSGIYLEIFNGTIDSYSVEDKEWFRRVVSEEFIDHNDLCEVFKAMQSNTQFDEDLLTIELQFTLPDLIPYLMRRLSLTKLQSAVTDEKTLAKILARKEPLIEAHKNVSPSKWAKIISKVISNEDNYTINFIINNGAFAQTLQAYTIDGEPPIIASDLNGLFIIDKQYLLHYLTTIFNGLVWSEEEKVPIIFDAKQPESDSEISYHDINTLIDTSGSMSYNFVGYQNNIKIILDKLGAIPNWQIEMVRFSHVTEKQSFSLVNGSTIDDVKNYVDSFYAGGGTRLYCTVLEALKDIRDKISNCKVDLYSTLMVFTDGDDNYGLCTENDVIDAASYLKAIPQFNMYAVGFGMSNWGYQKFFKRLTEVGGFVHIKLDDVDGMTQLQQYIDIISQKINVWEVVQGELKLSVSRVPEGDVFILNPVSQINAQGITIVKNEKEKFKIGKHEVECITN